MLVKWLILSLSLCYIVRAETKLGQVGDRQRKALVFGGNGFIGTEIVLKLLDEGFHVTTTNRGNWYWDSPVRAKTRVQQHFPCDRDDGVLNCWDLRNYIREVDFFDVVFDLTAYSAKVVTDTCKALSGKTGLYVLISSDSVYMVSRRDEKVFIDPDSNENESEDENLDENRAWKEEHATRPFSNTLKERLQEKDPYGHDKLSCEEALSAQRKQNGFPYVILRLPDVLGARDTTNRYWLYQIWLQNYQHIQLPFKFSYKMAQLRTSFVWIQDVVRAFDTILRINSTEIWDKAYNIAFEEGMTLFELLQAVQKAINIENVEYEALPPTEDVEESKTAVPGAIYMFPSVDFGYVDISRAKELLRWTPTPLEEALANITSFYKWAFGKFPLQRDKAVNTLLYNLPEENKQKFLAVLPQLIKQAESEVEQAEKKRVKEEL
ncbi:hypothetical protein CHUAL_013555 [Chamberlinius hualienensis]